MKKTSGPRQTNPTAMAGEFFVMEKLYRLGHEPALTVGRAKAIDILVETKTGGLFAVSVKAVRDGGKWPLGATKRATLPGHRRVYVLLRYRHFDDLCKEPEVFVIPGNVVERLKEPWHPGQSALYYSPKAKLHRIEKYRDAWEHIS